MNVADEQRTIEVLDRALERTKAKKLEWSPTKNKPSQNFWTTIGDFQLQVAGTVGDGPYHFWLLDSEQQVIGQLVTTAPIMARFSPSDVQPWERRVEELWGFARRQALGIDAAFDAVLDGLKPD